MVDLSPVEVKTKEFYDKNAKKWLDNLSVGQDSILFEQELNKFRELLPSGSILEIGSGAGNDAKWFLDNKYEYLGTDISEKMIDVCKSKNPEGKFLIKSVYDLDFPENSFDGFWSSITLLHLPKDKIAVALNSIHKVTRTGGIGFISLKKGKGEKLETKKERFYAYYSKDEFDKILKGNGFEVIESYEQDFGKTTFLIFFVKVKHE